MESEVPIRASSTTRFAGAAKSISDLDALIQAILAAVPQSKPWQRQLHAFLEQVDREVQILRMSIALGREDAQVFEATMAVYRSLRIANTYVAGGRADMGTKAAVRLAFDMCQKMERVLAADQASVG